MNLQYHENPHALHVGVMPNRAYYVPCADREEALSPDREDSSRLTMLSGDWRFNYYDSVLDLPEDIFQDMTFDQEIPVPSAWQMHGFDRHQYTNMRFPFPYDPPFVPQENPCGLYETEFDAADDGMKRYLVFEGVDSCLYLYVNEQFVGYSQIAHSTSEFDITPFVKSGENTVTALVLKWCDGSYFEDQDKLRMSGIFRDVYVLARPESHLRDYFVHTDLNKDFSKAEIRVETEWLGQVGKVAWELTDMTERTVASGESDGGEISIALEKPELWNAESPYLYTLILRAGDEYIAEPVGIREIKIENQIVKINGQSVKFRGVNRHDSDPTLGCAVDEASMYQDLLIMKQHNINAIRTSHYPNSPLFSRMCDEMGFYLIGEADVECHGVVFKHGVFEWEAYNALAMNPEYEETILDRVQHSVTRDKNRPCVVIWSMGNESGHGVNFDVALAWTKKYDPSRLTHYERASFPPKGMEINQKDLDLYSRMYPSIQEMEDYFTENKVGKPYILCEFTHAMGNGPGDCEDYFQLFERHPETCGGFVWEWCDHSVYMGATADGRAKYFYGGDWGEFPHDGNFCMDGLVYPDRTPHTGLMEYKNVIRPLRVKELDAQKGLYAVHNYMDFTVLGDYVRLFYGILQNGELLDEGEVDVGELGIAPHEEGKIHIDLPEGLTGDWAVNFQTVLAEETSWADEGHLLGEEQLGVHALNVPCPKPEKGKIAVETTPRQIILTGKDFRYAYNRQQAAFDEMVIDGRTLLQKPMGLNIWRAPTDNDRNIMNDWRQFGYDRATVRAGDTAIETIETGVKLVTPFKVGAVYLPNFLEGTVTWTVGANGCVWADFDVKKNPETPALPRFGVRMFLDKRLKDVKYFGFGPFESYIDKHQASRKDLFESCVKDLYEDYIKPQENGSHWNCDMVSLAGSGQRMTVVGENFCFNASEYTQEELTNKAHNFELEKSGYTVLCVDYAQNGIGSNSCGPTLLAQYAFNRDFKFSFRIDPRG